MGFSVETSKLLFLTAPKRDLHPVNAWSLFQYAFAQMS
jgi:hypothetical protein